MPARRPFSALLVFSLLASSLASAIPETNAATFDTTSGPLEVQRKHQKLSGTTGPAALLDTLRRHLAGNGQPGIYQEDEDSKAATNERDMDIPQGLVEVVKRQDGSTSSNSTTSTATTSSTAETSTTSTVSPTSTTPGTSSSSESTTSPTTESSTSEQTSQSSQIEPTTSPTTTPTEPTSRSSSSTTTSSPHRPPTTTKGPPAVDPTSSRSRPTHTLSTSNSPIDPTPEHPTPPPSITSLHVYTATMGGTAVVITETTVVPAPPENTDSAEPAGAGPTASLQPDAGSTKTVGMGILLGALGVVLLGIL